MVLYILYIDDMILHLVIDLLTEQVKQVIENYCLFHFF